MLKQPSSPTYQVVNSESKLSYLQQRIKYANRIHKNPFYFMENVPVWPRDRFPRQDPFTDEMQVYSDCNGKIELLEAIRDRDNNLYEIDLTTEHIAVTNGGMHGLSLAFTNIVNTLGAGSAICFTPVFAGVPKVIKLAGLELKEYSMLSFPLDAGSINDLVDETTRCIYLNFPNNPLGVVGSPAFVESMVNLSKKRNVALVFDLVYDSYIFDETVKLRSPFKNGEHNNSLIYSINSVSKNYGAPGLRIGWVESSQENIHNISMYLENECVSVCSPAQLQATKLIKGGAADLHQVVSSSRNLVSEYINTIESGFVIPPAGTQVLVHFPVNDVEKFADYVLMSKGLVLTTASNYYSSHLEQSIRIPTSYSCIQTERALSMLSESLKTYPN